MDNEIHYWNDLWGIAQAWCTYLSAGNARRFLQSILMEDAGFLNFAQYLQIVWSVASRIFGPPSSSSSDSSPVASLRRNSFKNREKLCMHSRTLTSFPDHGDQTPRRPDQNGHIQYGYLAQPELPTMALPPHCRLSVSLRSRRGCPRCKEPGLMGACPLCRIAEYLPRSPRGNCATPLDNGVCELECLGPRLCRVFWMLPAGVA